MRIAVAASGKLGTSVLRPLLESSHQVVAVLQDGRQVRGHRRCTSRWLARLLGGRDNFLKLAARHRLPVHYIDKMDEAELAPLRSLEIDVLLVSGFAIILKPALIGLPRIGCVNMHSSLLPRHRGPNPFSAVIVQGDAVTGVTFHRIDEGIDTGEILEQTPFEIGARDEMIQIYHRACQIAGERVVPLMDRIAREGLRGDAQDPALATYDRKLTEADAWIDWRWSTAQIDRMVRGFPPTVMPRFRFRGDVVYVAKAQPHAGEPDAAPGTVLRDHQPARIATGDGALEIRVAFCKRPLPWIWPSPFSRPREGERLEVPE